MIPAITYLNSEYPSLSHTFIEREVRALRDRGVRIRTVSVRPPTATGRMGATNIDAAAHTSVLQAGGLELVQDLLAGSLRSPAGVIRALIASQKLSPPGLSTRLRHAAYVVQGVRLARLMNAEGIRHVHVHMANNGAAIAMMACEFDKRIQYSLSIHGSAEFFHVDSWTLGPKAERATFVRCISNFCKAQVMAWTDPSAWTRFDIVRCGIDPDVYTPRPPREPGPLRLLTVGRMHPIKGYNLLLDACKLLADTGLQFELTMVGDGPLMNPMRSAVDRLGLGDRVRLAGAVPQEQIQPYFDRADAMVVSSFMEGVPVVLMEAMAKELGVVATRVGGIPELVEHGVSGFVVDSGSACALAGSIRAYAADPDLCRRHGVVGRGRVSDQYSIGATAEGMTRLFERFLNGKQTEKTQ